MRLGMELDPIDTVPPEQPTAQHEIPGSDFDLLAFTEDPHSPSVQVAAVAAAAEVAVYRPSMAILIANALSKQRSPSIRLRMAEAWASTWSHVVLDSSSPFESYETVSARPVVDSIWNLLTGPFAFLCHRFRIHMWVVFAAAFGTSTPKCLSSECLIKDRDILANKSMQKLPNAVRRSAALIRQKRTHEVQFSIKKKKGNTKKSDYMKATNETPSTVNMTEDITMEIL
uniref:Uncharacterized protein n=2 Tax=Spongospora subterranea TaxID=70186 RepID=A0A0H5RBB9_9EUKA|eukprot:CRZ11313.1 hypothetical protein [Spongospora subterranea]